jgi:hypothetical protein
MTHKSFKILRLTNKGTKDHKIKCLLIVNWTISLQLNKTGSYGPFKEDCYVKKANPNVKVHESYTFVYQCHKWSRICSTCRKHFAVLSWFTTYHVRVTRSLVLYVCFVNRCLSFCTFSFGHSVVCSSSIYGFWLPLWYLQTLLKQTQTKNSDTLKGTKSKS